MTATPAAVTVTLVTRMLREAFEGPPGPWTYFADTSPGTGVFATISGLTAAQASKVGGSGRTTIAGHIHHLSASVARSTARRVPEAPGCGGDSRPVERGHAGRGDGRDRAHGVPSRCHPAATPGTVTAALLLKGLLRQPLRHTLVRRRR